MLALGVDFGTTRTIVSYVDRGNYPIASFLDGDGDTHDHFPSVVAEVDGALAYGFDALAAHRHGAPLVRSVKRLLAAPDVTLDTPVRIGELTAGVGDVLTGFLRAMKAALAEASNLPVEHARALAGETPVTAVVAVPAHAHGAQRLITLEAFRAAGFDVVAMLNEPSAAGFEYTHRQPRTVTSRRTRVVVYDLGGGTFDASLVAADGTNHEVLASLGLNRLGGDDFDDVLVRCALDAVGDDARQQVAGSPEALEELADEARAAKEHLTAQTRRIVLDVAGHTATIPVDTFYQEATGLVDATIEAMAPLIGGLADGAPDLSEVAGVYLVGGSTGLPLVPRRLREAFGRRVHRSPYPAASTAIGLAIAADPDAGYVLTDRLSRGFGVFRESDDGRQVSFDAILSPQDVVSVTDDVAVVRRYPAAHNVGHFRFVEYAGLGADGQPKGDLMPFGRLVMPFDPTLQRDLDRKDRLADGTGLAEVQVCRIGDGPMIEERYVVDRHGLITVTVTDLTTGFTRTATLGEAR